MELGKYKIRNNQRSHEKYTWCCLIMLILIGIVVVALILIWELIF